MYTCFIHCMLVWYGIEDYQKDRIVVLKEHHTEEMQTAYVAGINWTYLDRSPDFGYRLCNISTPQ